MTVGATLARASVWAMASMLLAGTALAQSITPRPAGDGGSLGSGGSAAPARAPSTADGPSPLERDLTDARTGAGSRSVIISPRIAARATFGNDIEGVDGISAVGVLSPGLSIAVQRSRITGYFDYSLETRFVTDDTFRDRIRHNLLGRFSAVLVDDLLFVDTGGLITRVPRSLRRGSNIIPDFNVTDQVNVSNFFVSPRIEQRLEDFARLTFGYTFSGNFYANEDRRFTQVDPNAPIFAETFGDAVSDSVGHTGYVQLVSGPMFDRLQWTLRGSYDRNERSRFDGLYRSWNGTLGLEYAFTRAFRVVGSVGYEDIRDTENVLLTDPVTGRIRFDPVTGRVLEDPTRRNLIYDDNGVVWDVGLRLVPSRRTDITVRGGRRYGQTSIGVDGRSQISPHTGLTVSVADSLQNDGRLLSSRLSGLAVDQFTGNVFQIGEPGSVFSRFAEQRRSSLGTSSFFLFDPATGFLLLGDQSISSVTFRQRAAQLGLIYDRGRMTGRLDLFYTERQPLRVYSLPGQLPIDPAVLAQEDISYGINGGLSRSLSSKDRLTFDVGLRRYEFNIINPRKDWELGSSLGYVHEFSRNLRADARITQATRFTNTNVDEGTDVAITVGIEARF